MSSFPLTDPSSSAVSALPTIQTPSAGDQTFSLLDSSTPLYSTVPPSTVTHTYPAATLSTLVLLSPYHLLRHWRVSTSSYNSILSHAPPVIRYWRFISSHHPYGTGSPSTHPSVSLPGTSVLYSPTITAQVRLYRTLQSRYLILVLYLTLSSLTTLARLYIIYKLNLSQPSCCPVLALYLVLSLLMTLVHHQLTLRYHYYLALVSCIVQPFLAVLAQL